MHGNVGRGRRGPSVVVGHGEVEVPADGVAAVALEELAHTFRLARSGGRAAVVYSGSVINMASVSVSLSVSVSVASAVSVSAAL